MGFSVDVSRHDHYHVVHVAGDVDIYTAPDLSNCLQGVVSSGVSRVVVDLSRCEYFDSEGLKALIRARLSLGDQGSLVVRGLRGSVARVFQVASLDGFLNVVWDPTD